jgi:hypothetical protein
VRLWLLDKKLLAWAGSTTVYYEPTPCFEGLVAVISTGEIKGEDGLQAR